MEEEEEYMWWHLQNQSYSSSSFPTMEGESWGPWEKVERFIFPCGARTPSLLYLPCPIHPPPFLPLTPSLLYGSRLPSFTIPWLTLPQIIFFFLRLASLNSNLRRGLGVREVIEAGYTTSLCFTFTNTMSIVVCKQNKWFFVQSKTLTY